MRVYLPITVFLFCFILNACEETPLPPVATPPPSANWLIPVEKVFDAGVGKDGIPSVDSPEFSTTAEINSAFDDNLVLGILHEGELRAYPIPILNWHEIVNDDVNGLEVAITYCPLTGTGIGWSRRVDGFLTEFGVSGLLYNTNLMPYDRRTNSTWSQQSLECINGLNIGKKPETYTLIETTFATWKKSFPNSKVMNANTGFDRRYAEYPYQDYRTNEDLLFFPVANTEDDRLPAKERVLGVLMGNRARVYTFNEENEGTEVLRDMLAGQEIVIVRSKDDNYVTAFEADPNKTYSAVQDGLPAIMQDDQGNAYDLAGRIINGPDQGEILPKPIAFMGFWFSWAAFYPNLDIN